MTLIKASNITKYGLRCFKGWQAHLLSSVYLFGIDIWSGTFGNNLQYL